MGASVEGIVGLISCLLCAVPFMIIARFDKESSTPINFWSGDKSLKDKVVNVPAYNAKMSKMYFKCGIVFVISGICCMFSLTAGLILVCLAGTVGIYIAYRSYKKILNEYS